jgi:hypothetical protein
MGAGALAPGRVYTEFPKDKEFRAFEMLGKIELSLKPRRCGHPTNNANYQSWFWSHCEARQARGARTQPFPAIGGQFRSLVRTLCVCQGIQWSWVECRNFCSKWQPHLIYIYIYIHMPQPHFILSLHIHLATTPGPMRWRGSSAEHLCWRCSAVRWPWGRTGPFRRAPQRPRQVQASQVGPPLHLR